MELKALRFFVKVASTGSFTATAHFFRAPPSSVSRHIAALERELGQQLLFRHTRAVRLTDAGERYYLQVREALEQLDAATELVVDKDAAPRGVLRVNAPVALGRLHIGPLLAGFQETYPGLTLELTLTDAFIDPVQEGADLTVRVGHLEDSGLVARSIGAQKYLVCASPRYIEKRGMPHEPLDLIQHNCLVYKGERGTQRWYFRQPDEDTYLPYEISGNLRSNNAENLVAAALAGQGIVLFPSWLFSADSFRKGDLKPLLTDWMASGEPVPPGIHLLYPENRRRSRKVQLVSEYLLERIGDPPYWNGIG